MTTTIIGRFSKAAIREHRLGIKPKSVTQAGLNELEESSKRVVRLLVWKESLKQILFEEFRGNAIPTLSQGCTRKGRVAVIVHMQERNIE